MGAGTVHETREFGRTGIADDCHRLYDRYCVNCLFFRLGYRGCRHDRRSSDNAYCAVIPNAQSAGSTKGAS